MFTSKTNTKDIVGLIHIMINIHNCEPKENFAKFSYKIMRNSFISGNLDVFTLVMLLLTVVFGFNRF